MTEPRRDATTVSTEDTVPVAAPGAESDTTG